MATLRIENVEGKVLLVTNLGEIIPADIVTIKIQPGRPTEVKAQSRREGVKDLACNRFYANADTS